MKAWILGLAGALALVSLPAAADHRHVHVRPFVSFGFSYGHPFHGGWVGFPYYPSSFYGVGVWPAYPVRHVRTERQREERAFKLYVYPAAGQSERQMADDRFECHVWAADESGHDPTLGAGSRREADDYTRAFTACMEGRSYVVK